MKTSYQKLSLEIIKNEKTVKIIARDQTAKDIKHHFKVVYEVSIDNKEGKQSMLDDAKSWLWNMGNYNGQANELMNKYNTKWEIELGLRIQQEVEVGFEFNEDPIIKKKPVMKIEDLFEIRNQFIESEMKVADYMENLEDLLIYSANELNRIEEYLNNTCS